MHGHKKHEFHFLWTFPSYHEHDRGMIWYVVAGVVVGLLLVYSTFTENLLFGLLTVITTFVIFVRHAFEPTEIECEVTNDGIRVGSKTYVHENISAFWILEHADGRVILYLEEKRGLRSILPVIIKDIDIQDLRLALKKYIEEEKERKFEPFWEWIAHRLKL